MNQLDWLDQHRLTAIARRECDWVFSFSDGASLVATCLWRLIEHQRIGLTSLDDGQQFGLPTPVDAERRLNESLGNAKVVAVDLRDGTLDLSLTFENGTAVEILPDSSGYEAWKLQRSGQRFMAIGGGELSALNEDNA